MTDRLSDLMHQETATLDVPPPPAREVLAVGRTRRRQRRAVTAIGATTAVAVLAVALTLGFGGDRPSQRGIEPSGDVGGAAFAVGTTVYLDDGRVSAQIEDRGIKSLYYSSAGVLVRHGDNNLSDGGGIQRFSLVANDGSVTRIGVAIVDSVPAVDPRQPYLAYTEVTDGLVEVVVHDLTSDTEAARVPVPDAKRWSDWPSPPVALSGDTVFVGTTDVARLVDWRTGEVTESELLRPGFPDIYGGRVTEYGRDGTTRIRDALTGETLVDKAPMPMPMEPGGLETGYYELSPDGEFAIAYADASAGDPIDVIRLDTGERYSVLAPQVEYGWSAEGNLVEVSEDGRSLITCDVVAESCEATPLTEPLPNGFEETLRLGGLIYES